MLVDYEAAWLDLKALITTKSHHGQRDLLVEMGRLEVARTVQEGLPEKALRLYGQEFFQAVSAANGDDSRGGRVRSSDSRKDRALRGDSNNESEEDNDGNDANSGSPPGINRSPAAARPVRRAEPALHR